MVWVQLHEKFHGKTYKTWKKYKNVTHARKHIREWNGVANEPSWEHLRILKISKTRGGKAIRKRRTQRRSSMFNPFGF